MIATETLKQSPINDGVLLGGDTETLESTFIRYESGKEVIDLKNFILDSVFKINTYYNAYKFLRNGKLPGQKEKASKKGAEIFQTVRVLLHRVKTSSFFDGERFIRGEEIFQSVCDKRNSNHMEALSLIQATMGKDYTYFKAHLEEYSHREMLRVSKSE